MFGSSERLRSAEARPPADPLMDWSVQEGYSLQIVARGFSMPTAIAIVPEPGRDPKSPRMFVAELRGSVKTVANDWTVSEFARIETFSPAAEWPDPSGEGGMAGLCLAPEQGYVFVTYTHRDQFGVLRNRISRFTAGSRSFEGAASTRIDFGELFADDSSAFSHQIGGCAVDGDSLFVSVGDGGDPAASRSLDRMLGKLIRLTLDGQPHPGNPFFTSGGKAAAVYAYGLRNPFGITIVDGHVFSAENGVKIDRFLELRPGIDYQWDGTDGSLAANALAVFAPSICPVHVAYAPENQGPLQPIPNARFLIAISEGNEGGAPPGVLAVEYDRKQNMAVGSPRYVVRFESQSPGQGIVGVASTPGGLFLAPMMPVGPSSVLMMIRYDPDHAHPRIIGRGAGPVELMHTFGCLKCHSLDGVGGRVGPPLDKNALKTRVDSRVLDPSYEQLIRRIDAIPDKNIQATSPARKEVVSARPDQRSLLWVKNRLLFPRFDSPNAQMPQMNIKPEQADAIARYLLHERPKANRLAWIKTRLTSGSFLAGLGLGALGSLGLTAVLAIGKRRRARRPPSVSR